MVPFQPVILSGGSGTRLWPLSRSSFPKQFLSLISEYSLFQQTINRLPTFIDYSKSTKEKKVTGTVPANNPIVICNQGHRFLIAEQLRKMGVHGSNIVLEPFGRNTAPALTLAALIAISNDNDAVLFVLPSDHQIDNDNFFKETINQGYDLALDGSIVTFGITPTKAEVGYGYLKTSCYLANENSVKESAVDYTIYKVDKFIEKPTLDLAKEFLEAGNYFWNSGMFMMLASVWLKQLAFYNKEISNCCEAAFKKGIQDLDFYRIDENEFQPCPSISIDYAVMEKITSDENILAADKSGMSTTIKALALDSGWSDVGNWSSLWDISDKDEQGNVCKGDVYVQNCKNNFISAETCLVAALGINDITIVETADAVLVAKNNNAQDVKDIVSWLKHNKRSESESHRQVFRPWGSYESVIKGDRFQVKRIVVHPNAALSLQMHHHRAEHWIVVRGTARVTCGDKVFLISENQSTYIPIGTKHRLENPGTLSLEIIEVQSGSYLGEDDIVRYDDRYGRED